MTSCLYLVALRTLAMWEVTTQEGPPSLLLRAERVEPSGESYEIQGSARRFYVDVCQPSTQFAGSSAADFPVARAATPA